jgi:biopolymer transport protein ExbD
MIDTIVILLIFYMSFSRFAEMERDSSIKLPKSVAGEEMKKLPGQVILNMVNAEEISIGGEKLSMAQLPATLAALKARQEATDPLNPMSLILRGSKDLTYSELSDLMKACSKAGIANVTFATSD